MIRRLFTVLAALGIALPAVLMASGNASAQSAPVAATAVTTIKAEGPCPYSGAHPTIREGNQGPAVRHARCLLREIYKYPGIGDNDDFNTWFKANIMDFQTKMGLVADGVIGVNTWRALHG